MKACNVFNFTELLGRKWTLMIIEQIAVHKNKGFNVLFKRIKNISPKVLSSRLKELEDAGFLEKEIKQKPVRCYYRLSQKGEEAYHVFQSFKAWNSKYAESCHKKECVNCEFLK